MKTTLICTLGMSTPVITETLAALRQRGKTIDKLTIVHTAHKEVLNRTTRESKKEIGLTALKTYLQNKEEYRRMEWDPHNLAIENVLTEEHNRIILRKMLEVIAKERREGKTVYVSIAGGYKTMSAMALFAAYLIGCDGIFHILVQGNEYEVTEKYGFEVPLDLLTLVEIPIINLSPVLQTVLSEIDPENKYRGDFYEYLSAGADPNAVFQCCNEELLGALGQRKFKEEYERRREQYEQMGMVVDSILRARAKEAGIMRPQQERRVKSFESLVDKIDRKQQEEGNPIADPFDKIEDVGGVRVICYFQEDAERIKAIIENQNDFDIKEHVKKEPEFVGYTADHYIVTLAAQRTALIEYQNLKGVKCEIQVKTIFDHAWSQVEHRLRYKSSEYKQMANDQKRIVNRVFGEAHVFLSNTKDKFSGLRKMFTTGIKRD